MIVSGGIDAFGFGLNTGGKYNPGTNSWIPTNTTNAPGPRYSHTGVWTGTEMIVWGGIDRSQGEVNTGGKYNSTTDGWMFTSTTNAPDRRSSPSAIRTGREMIVWGGVIDGNNAAASTGGQRILRAIRS